jgi:hypothetical protein
MKRDRVRLYSHHTVHLHGLDELRRAAIRIFNAGLVRRFRLSNYLAGSTPEPLWWDNDITVWIDTEEALAHDLIRFTGKRRRRSASADLIIT